MICLDTNYLILGLVAGSRESRELSAWIASGERLMTTTLAWLESLCGPVTPAQVETMRAFPDELLPFADFAWLDARKALDTMLPHGFHRCDSHPRRRRQREPPPLLSGGRFRMRYRLNASSVMVPASR